MGTKKNKKSVWEISKDNLERTLKGIEMLNEATPLSQAANNEIMQKLHSRIAYCDIMIKKDEVQK